MVRMEKLAQLELQARPELKVIKVKQVLPVQLELRVIKVQLEPLELKAIKVKQAQQVRLALKEKMVSHH